MRELTDIIQKAKASPGKLTYGTSGVGTELHLAAEAVSRSAGIQMVHVPFRGGGDVIGALMGNQIDFAALSTASIAGALRQGTLRALAVSSPQRMTDFANVPTFAEIGHAKATMLPWWGMMAPAGTPRPVIERLTQELEKATKHDAVREHGGKKPEAAACGRDARARQHEQAEMADKLEKAAAVAGVWCYAHRDLDACSPFDVLSQRVG